MCFWFQYSNRETIDMSGHHCENPPQKNPKTNKNKNKKSPPKKTKPIKQRRKKTPKIVNTENNFFFYFIGSWFIWGNTFANINISSLMQSGLLYIFYRMKRFTGLLYAVVGTLSVFLLGGLLSITILVFKNRS